MSGLIAALFVPIFAIAQQSEPANTSSTRIQISENDLVAYAHQRLAIGDIAEVNRIADTMLVQDPQNFHGHMLKGEVARLIGRRDIWEDYTRAALRHSKTNVEKYLAALSLARAKVADEKYTMAQFWLRVARQNSPNDQLSASIAHDYQRIRQLNPWSSNISFGAAPSGNINGGSQGETAYLEGNVDPSFAAFLASFGIYDPATGLRLLGDNERALSGYEATFGIGTQYRLSQTASSATFLSAQADVARYWLSDESKDLSPTSENSDFSRDSLSFGLSHIRVLAEGMRPTTFSVGVGKSWYGGTPSNRYITASVSQPYSLSERDLLTLSGNVSVSANFADNTPVRAIGTSARLLHVLRSGDRIGGSVFYNRNVSDIFDSDSKALGISANYSFARPIWGMGLQFDASATYTDFGTTRFAPFDREETTLRAGANVSIPAAEIFGFQPVVSFTAEENRSTVDQFDRKSLGMGLKFQSSF